MILPRITFCSFLWFGQRFPCGSRAPPNILGESRLADFFWNQHFEYNEHPKVESCHMFVPFLFEANLPGAGSLSALLVKGMLIPSKKCT
jgi:hypothetical protein